MVWVVLCEGIFSSLQGLALCLALCACNVLKIAWGSVGKVLGCVNLTRCANRVSANVGRLCAGGGLEFRLPVTEVQFIDKCSLFILLLNVIRHAGTATDACT